MTFSFLGFVFLTQVKMAGSWIGEINLEFPCFLAGLSDNAFFRKSMKNEWHQNIFFLSNEMFFIITRFFVINTYLSLKKIIVITFIKIRIQAIKIGITYTNHQKPLRGTV